jgi:multiple sugar transport system ATP-binding protein
MSAFAVERLKKTFGQVRALDDVSFTIDRGEFFCVIGRTNAGKSTLLKTIAGIHRADRGRVIMGDRDVTDLPPHERHVSLLFQNIALFPTMTGFDNLAFPLRTMKLPSGAVDRKVRSIAQLLKVEHILERLPQTFSGGEQQRIAIGRAIIHPGDLLMLDEPLTNLDAGIRIQLRIEFKKLHRELGQTIIYVTHDQVEAMSLSERIVILDEGRVQQIGSPDEVYHRPVNRFVAEFIGMPPMNIVNAELSKTEEQFYLAGAGFKVPLGGSGGRDWPPRTLPRKLAFGIRPERLVVSPSPSEEAPIGAEILWTEHLGNRSILAIRMGDVALKAVVPPRYPLGTDKRVWIGMRPHPEHLLNRETGVFFRYAS